MKKSLLAGIAAMCAGIFHRSSKTPGPIAHVLRTDKEDQLPKVAVVGEFGSITSHITPEVYGTSRICQRKKLKNRKRLRAAYGGCVNA